MSTSKTRKPGATERAIWDNLTLDQFQRLPEAKPALEYTDGKVIQKVSPKRDHSALQFELGLVLNTFVRPRKLGRIYPELRCLFDGRSLVPDLCFIARGRIPRDEHGKLVNDLFLAPDLTVEIISLGQTVKNVSARMAWCARHGVRLAWLIQPQKRKVLVFKPDHPVEVLTAGQALVGEMVLPGFRLTLEEMFGWLDEE